MPPSESDCPESRPDIVPGLRGRRIAWVPLAQTMELASSRLRCLLPMAALRQLGLDVEIFNPERQKEYDAFVFQKAYEPHHLELAARLHDAGKPVLLDLCDHHLSVPSRDPALLARADRLKEMLTLVRVVTVTTTELARGLNLPDALHVDDFPDFPSTGQEARMKARRSRARWRWLSRKPLRLVWFGNAGSAHEGFGLPDLERILPDLNRCSRRVRLSLTVLSNNKKLGQKILGGAEFPTEYREWHYKEFPEIFAGQDLCLIPITGNAFTDCKTANRIMLALAYGMPVVTDFIPSYEPFRPFAAEANWEKSVAGHARRPGRLLAAAAAGRHWLLRNRTPAQVCGQWVAALVKLLAPVRPV